jgi:hypothetical protein
LGYRVFSFLFDWTDDRWDLGLRDRFFQFAPVYVSAETMRWWLGRECFATQKCILATREEAQQEDVEDENEDYYEKAKSDKAKYPQGDSDRVSKFSKNKVGQGGGKNSEEITGQAGGSSDHRTEEITTKNQKKRRGFIAWYGSHCPPFALWICGSDDLVDGRRLLRRFEKGREPHVKIVHCKIIEEYEHLDVIWAMDAVEKVGKEIKEVLWKTAGEARDRCRVPVDCEDVSAWKPDHPTTGGADGARKKATGGIREDEGDNDNSSSDESKSPIWPRKPMKKI